MSEKLKKILIKHLQNRPGWWNDSGKAKIIIPELINHKDYPMEFRYSGVCFSINPSIEFQKMLVKKAKYNLDAVINCPDWEIFDEEFEQEILDNMIIKDIIE